MMSLQKIESLETVTRVKSHIVPDMAFFGIQNKCGDQIEIESFVRMSSLSKETRDAIREELRVKHVSNP